MREVRRGMKERKKVGKVFFWDKEEKEKKEKRSKERISKKQKIA